MAGRVYSYDRFRGTAKRLISKFGIQAELRQDGVRYPTSVVLVDYKVSEIGSNDIRIGDFKALVAASDVGVVPVPKSQLFWEGRERAVIAVSVVKPGPDRVLYTLQMRGSR